MKLKKTSSPEPTKLGTKHPWVMCSNQGPQPSLREDNNEISKMPYINEI